MTEPFGRLGASLADRYRIERELGQGGMATVYLAHDVRHDRKVALKVLKPELSAILGAERFLAEIKTTANLQHPHILSLFDSGEADGLVFYVMPYVEGESLRDRITREQQLPVDDAVRIAREVADALEYAHQHQIVHRDIKPENILLQGGHALVADFGIALAASRSEGGTRMTETGMSLGTPHYMAPEQAMGQREITPKADIYALGCVLYEMLTGEPPFTGPTPQAIIARVMTETPRSMTLQRHTIPPHIEAIVWKALEKLPADRFGSAAAFAAAFDTPGSIAFTVPVATQLRARTGSRLLWAGITAALVVAAALAGRASVSRGAAGAAAGRPLVRFGIELPEQAGLGGGRGSTMAFAPDGSRIVYVGRGLLYVRGLAQVDPSPLSGTEGASLPFFSPDGQWIGFVQRGNLVRIPLAGGSPVTITAAPGTVSGASWTAGDTIAFAADSGLYDVPAGGGSARLIARNGPGEQLLWPDALPDGRSVLLTSYDRSRSRLAILNRASGVVTRLDVDGAYPHYVTGGFVTLNRMPGLLVAVPFDPVRRVVTGGAVQLTDALAGMTVDGDANVAVARSGDVAYQATGSGETRLVLVDRQGNATFVGSDTGRYASPRIAADGRRVVLNRAVASAIEVRLIDLVNHTTTTIATDSGSGTPSWSPDGRWIVFRDGRGVPARVPADGSGAPQPLLTTGRWQPWTFDRTGALIYYGHDTGAVSPQEIRRLVPDHPESAQTLLSVPDPQYMIQPRLSPDGRWIAYTLGGIEPREVFVSPYRGPGGRAKISEGGGEQPIWNGAGEIVYRNGAAIVAAKVRLTDQVEVVNRAVLFRGNYDYNFDVTPDGRAFVMLQPMHTESEQIVVTLNWFDQLRAQRR